MNHKWQNSVVVFVTLCGFFFHLAKLYSLKFYFVDNFATAGRCLVCALALYQLLSTAHATKGPPPFTSSGQWTGLTLLALLGGTAPLWLGDLSFQASALALGVFVWAQTQLKGIGFKKLHPLLLLILGASLYPLEALWAPFFNQYIQLSSAVLAAKMVNWTEFSVEVLTTGGPLLKGGNIEVHVTALCAGFDTVLTLLVLAIILALYFLTNPTTQLWFTLIAPLVSYAINVIRIAISTHAANQWLGLGDAWDVAHDTIGYVAFAINYMLFFRLLYLFKLSESLPPNPVVPKPHS